MENQVRTQGAMRGDHAINMDVIFTEAWQKIYGVKGIIIGAYAIIIFIELILHLLKEGLMGYFITNPAHQIYLSGALDFIIFLMTLPFAGGVILLGIKRSVGQPINIKILFEQYAHRLIKLSLADLIIVLASSLVALVTVVPLLMFANFETHILAGYLIWLFAFSIMFTFLIMTIPILVEKHNVGVLQAFKMSIRATKPHFIKIFLLIIATILILFASTIPFGIGLIWTLPWAAVIYGILYRDLIGIEPSPATVA